MQFNQKIDFDINKDFMTLYCLGGLEDIDRKFVNYLPDDLVSNYIYVRKYPDSLTKKNTDKLLIELGIYLEDFLAKLFSIDQQVSKVQFEHNESIVIFKAKRQFVQRYALKKYKEAEVYEWDIKIIKNQIKHILQNDFSELNFSKNVLATQDDEWLDWAAKYAVWATFHPEGKAIYSQGVLFKQPRKIDFDNLLDDSIKENGLLISKNVIHHRDNFKLTDQGLTQLQALDQVHYCILCHNQDKDSCSKGMLSKNPTEKFINNNFNIPLAGCPLEEKISQMHTLKTMGYNLGALAMIMVDNPLVAATGHRICNDCMRSCIYQKQDPVNIPGVETQILKEVLNLPWGFEIYSLLSRWNPLNLNRPLPLPTSGYSVLVAGMGPAGFNLSHHLLNEGHRVVGIDGLKIEPLPAEFSGVDKNGNVCPFNPIIDLKTIYEDLDERFIGGFGGVAEYGITVRWDKNFLKIIRLLLERRSNFSLLGGVMLGGTISVKQVLEQGIDHVALCTGSGSPNIIDIENNLSSGVRQASDFLMSLQLTGAGKLDSFSNMQIKLPVVVIGGGLTAIDTATEALAYYRLQVKKFAKRYNVLVEKYGIEAIRKNWSKEENTLADEMLIHSNTKIKDLNQVTIVYRKPFTQSPSYILNHEEVTKALQEGIKIIDCAVPKKIILDDQGNSTGLLVLIDDEEVIVPAKTVLVAAGTKPNINVTFSEDNFLKLTQKNDLQFFTPLNNVLPEKISKPEKVEILLAKTLDNKYVSYFGDLHPSFSGNVVKAMASAKKGYPIITQVLQEKLPKKLLDLEQNILNFCNNLKVTIHKVNILTDNIVEIVVNSKTAAQSFQPGQFYRLQNFASYAEKINGVPLLMEGIAVTGSWVDKDQGLIGAVVLEMGGSSRLCRFLKEGEPVILMGPTGTPTEITKNEKVILVGGGLGNAVLLSIGQSLRNHHSQVLYFAGYKTIADRYRKEDFNKAADQIIWCCDESPGFVPQDNYLEAGFLGNVVQAMHAYNDNKIESKSIFSLKQADRLIVVGSSHMMHAVSEFCKKFLPHLSGSAIGSINSPMQCMMKGICGQCLQKQYDPVSKVEKVVFSCVNQDQILDLVDFNILKQRLAQNSLQEKLTNQWISHLIQEMN